MDLGSAHSSIKQVQKWKKKMTCVINNSAKRYKYYFLIKWEQVGVSYFPKGLCFNVFNYILLLNIVLIEILVSGENI